MKQATDEEFTAQEWVYAGKRESTEGKPLDVYYVLIDGETGEKNLFSASKSSATIGGVYSVETNAKGSARLSKARYLRTHDKRAVILEWRALHEAFMGQRATANAERKAKDMGLSALDPIKRAYMSTNIEGRVAIEIMIMRYLRKGW